MSQCITCQWILMHAAQRGKGLCWKDADGTGKLLDVMEVRRCRVHQLAPLIQVQARSKRRFVFDAGGVATLAEVRNE